MRNVSVFLLVMAAAVMFASGCATGGPAIAAEAEPISVKVVPATQGSPQIVTIETTLGSDTTSTWELWYFYDVRDPKGTDPDAHLDADDYITMTDAARIQYVPSGQSKWTVSLTLKESRTLDTQLFVTVIAGSSAKQRGTMGSAELPKTAEE
jgi:hypothetical protein